MDKDVEDLLAGLSESEEEQTLPNDGAGVDAAIRSSVTRLESLFDSLPELAQLVADPLKYALTVKALLQKQNIDDLLPKSTALAVNMALADKQLGPITPEVLDVIRRIESLYSRKKELLASRADDLEGNAPNLLEILQPLVAAQLVEATGGLAELAQTPPANLASIGRKQGGGVGYLESDDLIQQVPLQSRRQAVRIVAGKVVMAARMDLAKSSSDGSQGREWRRNIEDRIDRLLAPPIPIYQRALPVPKDQPSKKRGGRKVRRVKQKYAATEAQKEANRIPFATTVAQTGSIRKTARKPPAPGADLFKLK